MSTTATKRQSYVSYRDTLVDDIRQLRKDARNEAREAEEMFQYIDKILDGEVDFDGTQWVKELKWMAKHVGKALDDHQQAVDRLYMIEDTADEALANAKSPESARMFVQSPDGETTELTFGGNY